MHNKIKRVFTYESEVITVIPPAKMFKACILDGDNLIPKIVPRVFKSVEYIAGNGEPGSIKKVTFGEEGWSTRQRKFLYIYSVTEGDALMNKLEKITYEMKLEASPHGGSICKTTCKYYTIGDLELKEEGIKAGKEKAYGIFKAIEAYLLTNPNAY
ncbi:hypothetical protein ES319_A02G055800v1 [Gossypium barbadense]|uniref:Bet v I/Major latex protein domain-containing protein n=3 Tax=Gossypium TaxID=3633 RepID=A0A5J5WNM2_GOSBA|nr:hypothetical protein ES319_A02G055800v1 [Gossypium barbadense]TYH27346.1 hypothetical protein ES288_A02G062800v1 [Gossypium darwinii]